MYFSKKNKNYMFETLSNIIFQETNIQIINNEKYINLYRLHYPNIFESINTDEISILNKELINRIGNLILKDINAPNNTIISEPKIEKNEKIEKIISTRTELLYSSQRNINSLNRYHFMINVFFDEFIPKLITLPKEENSLFSNPNINILFDNKDNLLFTLKETQKFGELEYYIYETFTNNKIYCKNILNIQIRNYLMNPPLDKYDIFTIKNIKKLNYEKNDYLCLDIENHDIHIGDELGLFSGNKIQIITSLFVKKIIKNYILTNLSEIDLTKNYSCLQMNKNITLTIEI